METEYYSNQTVKLVRSLRKNLKKFRKPLIRRYGDVRADAIISASLRHYPHIIPSIPYVDTPMYDRLLLLNSRMMALKKGMKDEGIEVEEFVRFQVETLRNQTAGIPLFIKRLMGRIYLSGLMRPYLKKVGKSASRNDWPTEVVDGGDDEDYSMKIITSDCQMLNFMHSVGEGDIQPYCSFADFTTAEALGLGLKQISSIESGTCTYCFYKRGKVHWPEAVKNILHE
jgi:hypothetical protein